MDVSKQSDWQRAIDAAISNFGKINVLVNNAGTIERDSLEETTEETWDRIMAVNAKGVFLGTQAVVPHMRNAGGGSIINISSISGMISVGYPAYNASKGAVRVFTKSTAVELARDNIRVNSIHPGAIWTSMSTYKQNRTREERAQHIPMGPGRRTRRSRLRCPLPRLRRVLLHDRKRNGHRWRHHRRITMPTPNTSPFFPLPSPLMGEG